MRTTEVRIPFKEREAGTSKMSTAIALEAMRLVTRWGWQRRVKRSSRAASCEQGPAFLPGPVDLLIWTRGTA